MAQLTALDRVTELKEQLRQHQERERCRVDYIYFIRNYLYIEEPRTQFGGPRVFKFDLWPKQEEFLHSLRTADLNSEFRCLVKCRGWGGTYVSLAYMFWKWLFTPKFRGLLGSRKAEEVDRGKDINADTLFAKMGGFLNRLPDWLRPKGYNPKIHRQNMLLHNPEMESILRGESSNADFGKSRRATMVILDEYDAWGDDVISSVLSVCSFTVAVSTIKARVGKFRALYERAKPLGYAFEVAWTDNKLYDAKWLTQTREEMDEDTFQREVLCNWEGSTVGLVYPQINDCPVGDYEYNPDWPLFCFWDFGYSDDTYIGFIQRDPETKLLYLIDEVQASQKDIEWFVNFIPNKATRPNPYIYKDTDYAKQDLHNEWRSVNAHFGDPSGGQRTMLSQGSIFKVLKEYGIRPKCNTVLWNKMRDRIVASRQALRRMHVSSRCVKFLESMSAYHYPERDKYSQSTSENEKPVHDWASHAATAFEAFAISENMYSDKEDVRSDQPAARRDPWKINK